MMKLRREISGGLRGARARATLPSVLSTAPKQDRNRIGALRAGRTARRPAVDTEDRLPVRTTAPNYLGCCKPRPN